MSRRRKLLRDLARPTLRMEKEPMNQHAIDVVHSVPPQHPEITIVCIPAGQPGQFQIQCNSPFGNRETASMLLDMAKAIINKLAAQAGGAGQVVEVRGPIPKLLTR